MIAGTFKFTALVRHTRVEDVIQSLMDQPHDMTVCQFCRITFGFTWNRLNTQLINLSGGSRREHNLVTKFREERKPEWVILVHIQNTWNADFATVCFVRS